MPHSSPSIRLANIHDLEAIVSLLAHYRNFYCCQNGSEEALKTFIETRLQHKESAILLAFLENKAVGIAQLYPCFSTLGLSKIWILNDLFVESNYRGHRIGKALINAAVAFAKKEGAKRIDLKTEHDNHTAKALYEKYGFQRDEIYDHYRFIIE